jgi:hypothetical protein
VINIKREDFKKIIKLRSVWKIDKRKGDYKLPNGKTLSFYLRYLVETQLDIDGLFIRQNGNLCSGTTDKKTNIVFLMPDFGEDETCSCDKMEQRVDTLVRELIYS